jgi:hypothetical protein
MQRAWAIGACAVVAVLASRDAAAQTKSGHHEGFYVRVGGGLSYFVDSVESEPYEIMPNFAGTAKGTVKGVSPAFELAIGHSISPGLILGGGMYAHLIPSPSASGAEVNGMGITTKLDINFASTSMILVGPFVDYYVGPDSGLHVQGSLGLGILSLGEGTVAGTVMGFSIPPTPSQKGYGLAGMLGAGYEWRLAGAWSIGVLGRILAGRGSGDDTAGVNWTHTVFVPGLLATVTMN